MNDWEKNQPDGVGEPEAMDTGTEENASAAVPEQAVEQGEALSGEPQTAAASLQTEGVPQAKDSPQIGFAQQDQSGSGEQTAPFSSGASIPGQNLGQNSGTMPWPVQPHMPSQAPAQPPPIAYYQPGVAQMPAQPAPVAYYQPGVAQMPAQPAPVAYYQPGVAQAPAQPVPPVYYHPAGAPVQPGAAGYYYPGAVQAPVQPMPGTAVYQQLPTGFGGQPYYGAPPEPKQKLPLGLKVFLWIFSFLAAGTILGFVSYYTYLAVAGVGYSYVENNPFSDMLPMPEEEVEALPPAAAPDVDVTPNTEGITIQEQPTGTEQDAQEVYARVVKSTVTVQAYYQEIKEDADSTGTGIIATSDGYIITNSHVVLNSKSTLVQITTYDEKTYDAVVVGVDRTTDLAVLKTNDYQFTPAAFGNADQLKIGDSVLAIGNPAGARFSGSLTRGIISGLNREVGQYSENGMTYIQTDAAINPGNSGGPLVNMYGQVVGINSSKIVSAGYEGMGFAIPVSKAQPILNDLLSGGYVKGRVRLGIRGSDITPDMAMIYGVPAGFLITEITEGGAFEGTKAEIYDIIIALDGNEVTGITDISQLLLKYSAGDTVKVTLYRMADDETAEGEELEVEITLLEDKGETQG